MSDATRASRSFQALVVTQFLGAFNDNAFKQLILLLAVDRTGQEGGGSWQALAMGLFALPFLLFSGVAGTISDRWAKPRMILIAKIAEIAIMGLGAIAFALGSLWFLLATLFLMGSQSAFFGPAKYGILPEMLPCGSLARANGVILMTTFLSIILGQAAAGWLALLFAHVLYRPAIVYVLLAVAGTLSALRIHPMPPARPDLRLTLHPLGDLLPTLGRIFADPGFRLVLIAYSFFWFLGGVLQLTMNVYGRLVMGLDYAQTSYLLATLSAGMAAGGILGAALSRGRTVFRLVDAGTAGMVLSLGALTVAHQSLVLVHGLLFLLGISGSLFALPLQTYVQQWAPEGEKGRVVAASNFVNWVFIFLSAGYFALVRAPAWFPIRAIPASLALLVLSIGLMLSPRLRRLEP